MFKLQIVSFKSCYNNESTITQQLITNIWKSSLTCCINSLVVSACCILSMWQSIHPLKSSISFSLLMCCQEFFSSAFQLGIMYFCVMSSNFMVQIRGLLAADLFRQFTCKQTLNMLIRQFEW
jgi:hypothetical protein